VLNHQVGAGHLALERLLTAIPAGSPLETLDISGNALIPSKKKTKSLGYSPKSLKKILQKNLTPHLTNAVKTVSDTFSSQLQTASELFEAKKNALLEMTAKGMKKGRKSYKPLLLKSSPKSTAIANATAAAGKSPTPKQTAKQQIRSKQASAAKKGRSKQQPSRRSTMGKGKETASKSGATDEELAAERELQKVRIRAMRALLTASNNARRLKTLGLAKVGLTEKEYHIAKKLSLKLKLKASLSKLVSSNTGVSSGTPTVPMPAARVDSQAPAATVSPSPFSSQSPATTEAAADLATTTFDSKQSDLNLLNSMSEPITITSIGSSSSTSPSSSFDSSGSSGSSFSAASKLFAAAGLDSGDSIISHNTSSAVPITGTSPLLPVEGFSSNTADAGEAQQGAGAEAVSSGRVNVVLYLNDLDAPMRKEFSELLQPAV
jgi:hypothetical protein